MELADFKTYVKQTFKRTDKDTEIVRAYNDMLRWLAAKFPIGDYKFQSYVFTTEGVEDYELPIDLAHLLHPIRLLDGNNSADSGYPLTHITKAEYDIREPNPNRNNPSKGKPDAYTIFSRSILLAPIPDSNNYILEINWAKQSRTQATNIDTPAVGVEYDEILKYGTLERLYEIMEQFDLAMYYASKYKDAAGNPTGALKDLLNNEVAREGEAIGRIIPNNL